MPAGAGSLCLWQLSDMRIAEYSVVGGNEWAVTSPGRRDDHLVCGIAMELARQLR